MTNTTILSRETFHTGQMIFTEGSHGNHAYFLEKGQIEVFIGPDNDKKTLLAVLGANTVIGEMALIGNGIRTASIRALEPCVLVRISEKDFKRHLHHENKIYRAVLDMLVERLQKSNLAISKSPLDSDDFNKILPEMVDNFSKHMSVEKRKKLKTDLKPILKDLLQTIEKYNK